MSFTNRRATSQGHTQIGRGCMVIGQKKEPLVGQRGSPCIEASTHIRKRFWTKRLFSSPHEARGTLGYDPLSMLGGGWRRQRAGRRAAFEHTEHYRMGKGTVPLEPQAGPPPPEKAVGSAMQGCLGEQTGGMSDCSAAQPQPESRKPPRKAAHARNLMDCSHCSHL